MKTTLTPALSRPTGEGELFAGFWKCCESGFAERYFAKLKMLIAVPSPIGWERVRVRAF
jgi:hypothetical protein